VEANDLNDVFDFTNLKKVVSHNDTNLSTQNNLGSAQIKKSQSSNSNSTSNKKEQDMDDQLGFLFTGKNNNTNVNLNAKKLDLDFDNMDFFNAFDNSGPKKEKKVEKPKQEEKIQEKPAEEQKPK